MTDEVTPLGSEPWTGYQAGMPAPLPGQPGGRGPHRARGWIALRAALVVSVCLVGSVRGCRWGPRRPASTLPCTGPILPCSPCPGPPSGAAVGTVGDLN